MIPHYLIFNTDDAVFKITKYTYPYRSIVCILTEGNLNNNQLFNRPYEQQISIDWMTIKQMAEEEINFFSSYILLG